MTDDVLSNCETCEYQKQVESFSDASDFDSAG